VIYSDFLKSSIADSIENFRLKIAMFSANSSNTKLSRQVRFNKNRDFDDIGNSKVNKEVT
jgi:hypothetical protein